ncbi:MAG: class I SAM-dependent DNA methyltransferase [Desulfamplus sp.]|nr:class I SAM-dependent DNA methyltransferase [Desulfamplus sp.]
MPLSWNEIKSRALAFSKEWADETSENAEAKSFWDGFFNIFGISRRRIASFEEPVKKLGNKQGFIDLFWKGVIVAEHKSRGKSLDTAYTQALGYFHGIKERDLPRYILVSDFAKIRIYDLDASPTLLNYREFELKDLYYNVNLFGFIAGYQTHKIEEQDPVNIKAAEQMGKLHDLMKDVGYEGHHLELYLVRLLFCMFAEDTGIFERQQFQDYIEDRTNEDGSDLGQHINSIFEVLNKPEDRRFKNLDEQLAAFPYINGKLFEEMLPTASFDSSMRQTLLDCCALDWGRISPAIFGSLFQSIMDKQARRNLGAHYTSESNILKLIKPLFLDSLREEFEKIKHNRNRLGEFHEKLRSLNFLDPACGCGNFLVITYRELRLLELDVLRILFDKEKKEQAITDKADPVKEERSKKLKDKLQEVKQHTLDINSLIKLNVDQFYGIEIEEFPAQIAQVALWLMDHQMNLLVSEEFGLYFARIPLSSSSTIICGNALQIDWNDIIAAEQLSYIMGNPPFVGKKEQSAEQKKELISIFNNLQGSGNLDYVTCWYVKSCKYLELNPRIESAFVSTNSISQGEQVGIFWRYLKDNFNIKINFTYQTFKWTNEAKGAVAVHCVIISFAKFDRTNKNIFLFVNAKNELGVLNVKKINSYLVEADDIFIGKRKSPICNVKEMKYGSMPIDNGFLIFSDEDKNDLIKKNPSTIKFFRQYTGGFEFINNHLRWCLWLKDFLPNKIRESHEITDRIEQVRNFREASSRKETIKLSETPYLFGEIRQPNTNYILIPKVSSENRKYIPIGIYPPSIIASGSCLIIPDANLFSFGILTSTLHMAWLRCVCGRMKSDYQYSASIVYNNFPWPQNPTDKQKKAIEDAAQGVLDARSQFPDSSLADLYDPLTMPPTLLKAHHKLDKAVDTAYGKTNFKTEAERVAFLFELYQTYLNELPVEKSDARTCVSTDLLKK